MSEHSGPSASAGQGQRPAAHDTSVIARPESVTAVAWLLIFWGCQSLFTGLAEIRFAQAHGYGSWWFSLIVPTALLIPSGIGIRKGQNWARYLFAASIALLAAPSLLYSLFPTPPAPLGLEFAVVAAFALFLFSPRASAFFSSRQGIAVPPRGESEAVRKGLPARQPFRERGMLVIFDVLCVLYMIIGFGLLVRYCGFVVQTIRLAAATDIDPSGAIIASTLIRPYGFPALAFGLVLMAMARGLPAAVRLISLAPPAIVVVAVVATMLL